VTDRPVAVSVKVATSAPVTWDVLVALGVGCDPLALLIDRIGDVHGGAAGLQREGLGPPPLTGHDRGSDEE
jgi:hypothetical protein